MTDMKENALSQPEPQKRPPKRGFKNRDRRDPFSEKSKEIADTLGEDSKKPRTQIINILRICGVEFADRILAETIEVEANGGLMVSTGERRRTMGGVFFYLAREQMTDEQRKEVFFGWQNAALRRQQYESRFPAFIWEERAEILERISGKKGEVLTMRVQISGQPAQFERRQNLVVLAMEHPMGNMESLPKGVPRPPETSTYTVYLAGSQWDRVADAAAQQDDELIIDGYCAYDPETQMLVVYGQQATTKKLLKQERNQQKEQAEAAAGKNGKAKKSGGKGEGGASRTSASAKESKKVQETAPPPLQIEMNLPPGLPAPVVQKLTELYTAAASFRQKISSLEAKPVGQQFGLEMTQKLLKNTEQQIEKLEKQYTPKT